MLNVLKKERFHKKIIFPPWVGKEHFARYFFASKFIHNAVVVDCACGSGEGTRLFSERARKVIAVDISQEAIAMSEANNQKKNVSFIKGDVCEMPIEDNSADVFVSLETVEHVKDENRYLKEVSRILTNSGFFVCSTPNRVVTNPSKTIYEKPANKFHLKEYSTIEFRNLLEKQFSYVKIFGLNKNSRLKVDFLCIMGRIFHGNFAVGLHQLYKLIFYTFKPESSFVVEVASPCFEYEYLIAVCQK